jgi:Glycosyl hydrolase family 26
MGTDEHDPRRISNIFALPCKFRVRRSIWGHAMSSLAPRKLDRSMTHALKRFALGYSPALLVALLGACSSSSTGAPSSVADGGNTQTSAGTAGQPTTVGTFGGAGAGGSAGSTNSGGESSNSAGAAGSGGGATMGGAANAGAGGAGGSGTGGHGGSAGTGGSSAGGQAGAGGSGGLTADCGVDPVTPNATQTTRKVLCYLHSIYGNHILSGQEENNDDDGMNTIFKATGKYPAIRAFDVNNSMAPTQCVQHWNNGGICMFGYHMGIDGNSFSVAANINNVLTSGTMENKSFNQDLDRIAEYVQPLQQAGGVAILRLFHEAGKGCNWFWWTMGTSAQWQDLFKYAFNYLTATKGLNNVIWIAPLCGSPDSAYNPGSKYIDLGGADDYVTAGDYEPLTNLFNQTVSTFPNMMVALHECGSIPDPDQLKSSSTKWLFFNVWSGNFITTQQYNPTSHLQAVYSSDYVITRDELPSFK